jgi:hypothetical protein
VSIELCASQHECKYTFIRGCEMIRVIHLGVETYRDSSACINAGHDLESWSSSIFYSTKTRDDKEKRNKDKAYSIRFYCFITSLCCNRGVFS